MLSNIKFKTLLYMATLILALGLAVPCSMLYLRLVKLGDNIHTDVVEGHADLRGYDFVKSAPISLDGYFLAHRGVFFDEDTVDYSKLESHTLAYLPTADLQLASGTYTFRVFVALDEPTADDEELLFALPFLDPHTNVYINGAKVNPLPLDDIENHTGQLSYYSLTQYFDTSKAEQEICISVNESGTGAALFKRDLSISTYENHLELYKIFITVEAYFVGMMFISILNTIAYTILYPRPSTLVYTNIFDTALMLHAFFNVLYLPTILGNLLDSTTSFDYMFRRIDLACLFLAGLLTHTTFAMIFKKASKYTKDIDRLVIGLYLAISITVVIYPEFMSGPGMTLAFMLVATSFVLSVVKFCISYRTHTLTNYHIFHFFKQLFICFSIGFDVVTINTYSDLRKHVLTLYCTIFLFNLASRFFEYRFPFMNIKKMNANLEDIVKERTLELAQVNEELHKLVERDALTGAYNRLYFEDKLDELLVNYLDRNHLLSSVYLCIFDADNFKRINDTYGHSVGDEQLIEMASLPRKLLPDDVLITRIGGEEFALIFMDHTAEFVFTHLELLRKEFERLSQAPERTTASFGLTRLVRTFSKNEFFQTADKSLYHSKTNGKNMISYNFDGIIEVYDPSNPPY